ncbi:MAG: hypothetical protein CMD08_00485 [Flavobacteriales bacterium]|nr:hypothetical protein [Flavobacteriales bacterium]
MLNRYFVNSTDAFVAISESVYNDLDHFVKHKKKILSIHPLYDNFGKAVDKDRAISNLSLDKDYRYMLFFGIIRQYKGLDILLEAFSDNRLQTKNIKLIIAGEFYEDSQPYYDLIDKYNLSDSVVLVTNFIPDNEVSNYFCAADIIVQPYKHATQSGVTQIAYHFDKPMLVTNVGGLKEIVPHNKVGYVCKPQPNDVADYLVKFFSQNKESDFIKGVKEEKHKYSWSRMIDDIKFLYSKLV